MSIQVAKHLSQTVIYMYSQLLIFQTLKSEQTLFKELYIRGSI